MADSAWALSPIAALVRTVLEPKAAWRAIRRKMPNVIHVGYRATCTRRVTQDEVLFCKAFQKNAAGMLAYARECLADDLFGDETWKLPIIERGEGWLLWPLLPTSSRVDLIAPELKESERREIGKQAIEILRQIHSMGYAHRDFHAGNMFWIDGRLIVTDFEWLEKYPRRQRPTFERCYDLTGKGLPSPGMTGHCHFDCGDRRSLKTVLRLSSADILATKSVSRTISIATA